MLQGFAAVAIDYDGTLTQGSRPEPEVLDAIAALRADGRRVVLVTGRILTELRHAFPEVDDWFDAIVAENGAVLSIAARQRRLVTPVAPALEDALIRRRVPVRGGEVLLACDAVHDVTVLEEIHRLGLDHQVLYNRAALMVLPAGASKGTGLCEALEEFRVSRHSTIGIGDAENDHALLEVCELGVAVANAVPSLRERADVVLDHPDGAGVVELLRSPMLRGEERAWLPRRQLVIGHRRDGTAATIPTSQVNVLVTGSSNSGKSYVGGMLAEGFVGLGYSVLLIDFEGDHTALGDLPGTVLFGGTSPLPSPETVAAVLCNRDTSVVVDLSMSSLADQDAYVAELASSVVRTRRTNGVPHWLIVDEAHRPFGIHAPAFDVIRGQGHCLITWRPEQLHPDNTATFDIVIALRARDDGSADHDDLPTAEFLAKRAGFASDRPEQLADTFAQVRPGQALLAGHGPPEGEVITLATRSTSHVRHWRKYTEAQLPEEQRFHFRNARSRPTGQIAANVHEFHHILRRCDGDAIDHHSRHRDFSRWAAESLRDTALASTFTDIEHHQDVTSDTTRTRRDLLDAIERRYIDGP